MLLTEIGIIEIASVLILCRIVSASLLIFFDDCDEVYNYWEPLHFLIYGEGFQTWEYAPQYALRSWSFLLPFAALATHLGASTKVYLFLSIRAVCAVFSGIAEACIVQHFLASSGKSRWIATVLLASSAGMSLASPALLPNSLAMTLSMFMIRFRHGSAALWCIALISITAAWPFACILALNVIDWKMPVRSIGRCIRQAWLPFIVVATVSLGADWTMYGQPVFPALNSVLYNAVQDGAKLYGSENTNFYMRSLFLNFNLLAPLAAAFVALSLASGKLPGLRKPMIIGMIYFLAFNALEHKEVRFLFPIYPLVPVGAAASIELLNLSPFTSFVLVTASCVLSLSRMAAWHKYYSAPVQLFRQKALSNESIVTSVDWYRFPGSFFLPEGSSMDFGDDVRLQEQLPRKFEQNRTAHPTWLPSLLAGLNPRRGTWFIPGDVNDRNERQPERFRTPKATDQIFVLETSAKDGSRCIPMINASQSGGIRRSFYIPPILLNSMAQVVGENYVSLLGKVTTSQLCLRSIE